MSTEEFEKLFTTYYKVMILIYRNCQQKKSNKLEVITSEGKNPRNHKFRRKKQKKT